MNAGNTRYLNNNKVVFDPFKCFYTIISSKSQLLLPQ
jgi:hypothetical protein